MDSVINRVKLAPGVVKVLPKLPPQVRSKLKGWIVGVENFGLDEMRKIPGYHDEPLSGSRAGQRSIRLSKGWRAFYVIRNDGTQYVLVIDVNHHNY